MSGPMLHVRVLAVVALLVTLVSLPADAWYYFTARNGIRMTWRSSYRPVSIVIDTDYSTFDAAHTIVNTILNDWNTPFGNNVSLFNVAGADFISTTMTPGLVSSFMQNPTPGKIWIVHDTTGAIFDSMGLDRTMILGLGIPFSTIVLPSEIVSGVVLVNYWRIAQDASPSVLYQKTLLHEMGHVLGLAHSISGGNRFETVSVSNANLPVMYPFATLTGPTTLQKDDEAAVLTMYGL